MDLPGWELLIHWFKWLLCPGRSPQRARVPGCSISTPSCTQRLRHCAHLPAHRGCTTVHTFLHTEDAPLCTPSCTQRSRHCAHLPAHRDCATVLRHQGYQATNCPSGAEYCNISRALSISLPQSFWATTHRSHLSHSFIKCVHLSDPFNSPMDLEE